MLPKITMSTTVIVFLCILRATFALTVGLGNEYPPKMTVDVQEAVKRFLTDFAPAGQNHTKANQWIFVVAEQASGEQLENAVVAKIASINDVALTAELVGLADGYHLIVPRDDAQDVEKEQRTTAVAVVNMLMDLKTMERMDTILANCSLRSTLDLFFNETGSMVTPLVAGKGGEHIERLFGVWLRSIAAILRNDARLSVEFANRMNEAEADQPTEESGGPFVRGNDSAEEEKLAKKMANSRLFRRAALNRLFLKHASTHMELINTDVDRKRFFLARALIDLAGRHGQHVELNGLYREALAQVAENMSETENVDEMREKFFAHLEAAVERDDELSQSVKAFGSKMEVWIAFRGLRRSLALI